MNLESLGAVFLGFLSPCATLAVHIFKASDGGLLRSPEAHSKKEIAPYGASRENFQKSVALLRDIPVAHHLSLKVVSLNLGIQKNISTRLLMCFCEVSISVPKNS